MAACPTCGNSVSPEATVCPDCGMDLTNVALPADTPAAPPATALPDTAPPAAAAPAPHDASTAAAAARPITDRPASAPAPAANTAVTAEGGAEPTGAAVLTLRRAGVLMPDKYHIGDDVVLGRFDTESGPVDIDFAPLPEASYISRHHARLKRSGDGRWTVQDLGSRNGTFVKASGTAQFVRIKGEHVVADGDEIALGNARFHFSIPQPAASGSTAPSAG